MDNPKELILHYALPLRLGILLVTAVAILVCVTAAIQSIPLEAMGLTLMYLFPPGFLIYGSWIIFSYRIRVQEDGVLVEAIPNPFAPRFRCRYDDISRIEKGENCLGLDLYRFQEAEPCRIPNMNLLDGGPLRLVDEIRRRIPEDRFFYRSAASVKRYWRAYAVLDGAVLLLGAAWASLLVLDVGAWLTDGSIPWPAVETALFLAVLFLLAAEWILLRAMNRDA